MAKCSIEILSHSTQNRSWLFTDSKADIHVYGWICGLNWKHFARQLSMCLWGDFKEQYYTYKCSPSKPKRNIWRTFPSVQLTCMLSPYLPIWQFPSCPVSQLVGSVDMRTALATFRKARHGFTSHIVCNRPLKACRARRPRLCTSLHGSQFDPIACSRSKGILSSVTRRIVTWSGEHVANQYTDIMIIIITWGAWWNRLCTKNVETIRSLVESVERRQSVDTYSLCPELESGWTWKGPIQIYAMLNQWLLCFPVQKDVRAVVVVIFS